jgi:hypothetical protein
VEGCDSSSSQRLKLTRSWPFCNPPKSASSAAASRSHLHTQSLRCPVTADRRRRHDPSARTVVALAYSFPSFLRLVTSSSRTWLPCSFFGLSDSLSPLQKQGPPSGSTILYPSLVRLPISHTSRYHREQEHLLQDLLKQNLHQTYTARRRMLKKLSSASPPDDSYFYTHNSRAIQLKVDVLSCSFTQFWTGCNVTGTFSRGSGTRTIALGSGTDSRRVCNIHQTKPGQTFRVTEKEALYPHF